MTTIQEIRNEFIRIYEGLMTIRGLPIIFGRIIAVFLIEGKELTQEEIAKLTEYSISSVSRTLEQMIRAGIVRKTKDMNSKQFIYSMHMNIMDIVIGSIIEGNRSSRRILEEIDDLRKQSKLVKEDEKTRKQKKRLEDKIEELESSLKEMVEITEKLVEELKSR